MRWGREDGAGSVLAIAVAAATGVLVGTLLPLLAALSAKQRVASAADAAALAAADVAVGIVAGAPCALAAHVAEANDAAVTACELRGLEATVTASVHVLGIPVTATATAGPPPAATVEAGGG